MGKIIDLTGQRFGNLMVLEFAQYDKYNRASWSCLCECGNNVVVASNNLRRGLTQSCGCMRNKRTSERFRKHGMHGSSLYKRWKSMKERCSDIHNPRYGGRGITVCDEWKNDFQAFYDWSMANGYSEKLQLDRINNDGNYEPTNCRWVTPKANSENRSDVQKIKVTSESGVKVFNSISEASDSCGIPKSVIHRALCGRKIRENRYSFEYSE